MIIQHLVSRNQHPKTAQNDRFCFAIYLYIPAHVLLVFGIWSTFLFWWRWHRHLAREWYLTAMNKTQNDTATLRQQTRQKQAQRPITPSYNSQKPVDNPTSGEPLTLVVFCVFQPFLISWQISTDKLSRKHLNGSVPSGQVPCITVQ